MSAHSYEPRPVVWGGKNREKKGRKEREREKLGRKSHRLQAAESLRLQRPRSGRTLVYLNLLRHSRSRLHKLLCRNVHVRDSRVCARTHTLLLYTRRDFRAEDTSDALSSAARFAATLTMQPTRPRFLLTPYFIYLSLPFSMCNL